MWNTLEVDLGQIKAKVRQLITFTNPSIIVDLAPRGNAPLVRADCGCSTVQWDQSTGTLQVVYTPTPVPIHMKQSNRFSYTSVKRVFVTHDGGKIDTLYIKASVID